MPLLGRDTWVSGPFPKGVLLLETLHGQEALGRPYNFQLGLLSKDPAIEAKAVLGKPLAVGIKLDTGGERFFHGIVTRFDKVGTARLHTRYQAELTPKLWVLAHTGDCRIFNQPGQDALGIVTAVLAKRGLTDVESGALSDHTFRAREYCVQYRESDFHFVQRLLEEEGIHYFFRHEEAKHTLVLADSLTGHETVDGYPSILYTSKESELVVTEEHFWELKVRKAFYPGRHTVLAGYDATKVRPKQLQFGRDTSEDLVTGYEFEHYDYPGGLFDPEEAQREAEVRTQVCSADNTVVEVEGNPMGLGVGNLVSLRNSGGEALPFWRDEDFSKQYLIVGASYSLSIDQYETGDVAKTDQPYRARYWLLDNQIQFRPARTERKPVMHGPQTAVVVGPPGEEIWTDQFGRVMVQFDWDRLGKHNEKSSCWIRVAQPWAGGNWGGTHLPRIGQEVIVRFLDGDPDRPVIGAQVYSEDNQPPYDLPANQTQSGTKSRSSKGGTASNFNEIRFDDLKGREELHTQAEKDMSTLVKDDQALRVGANRNIEVGNDETNLVNQDRDLTVNVNDSVVINGKHDKTVTGMVTQIYGKDHSRKVDGEQELAVDLDKNEHVALAHTLTTDKKFRLNQSDTSMTFKGTNVSLSSAGEIAAMAGNATIFIDKTGTVTFDSPTGINLLCGGSGLSILPGGIAVTSPVVTAAAGAASTMAMGQDAVSMNGKKVLIEAQGVCKITGRNKLKLQESESKKGKKKAKASGGSEGDDSAGARERAARMRQGQGGSSTEGATGSSTQKQARPDKTTLEIHAVDLDGKPQDGLAFQIKKPDGVTENGKLDKEGRGLVKSATPGTFTVTFPDLDGADWDGDGAEPLPPEDSRSEASRYTVQQGDRLPTIASDHGFARWQTIWDFPSNAALKDLRGNAHILFPKDKVSIPTKLPRKAVVEAGATKYVVHFRPEVLRVRFSGLAPDDNRTVTFKAEPDVGPALAGPLKSDGTMELDLPENTEHVVVKLFLGNADQPFETHQLRVGHLDPIQEVAGVQARLANLGYYAGPINGQLDEATLRAISTFRSLIMGDSSSDIDGAFINALDDAHGV